MANGNNGEEQLKPSEMSVDELPDVRAFEDEFTRGFMKSTEEAADGYYTFESGTGEFTMLFPENGTIAEGFYSREENVSESFLVGAESESLISQFDIQFDRDASFNENTLLFLEERVGEELDFKKEVTDKKEMHTAPFTYEDDVIGLAAFIGNTENKAGLRVILTSACNEDSSCDQQEEEVRQEMRTFLETIEFKSK
ncbi:hypothetical protein E2R51_16575 [Jeotgalibacillus sp. S-D1]|uniref:hypothetical protein n=1 Tax=Jeotgalibacillus sp. S-D1 TaxID=2552189 RepID=UPI0010595480|nr:hypothetical protein [Jeotgalibacillus sp. S-D1]TDL30937.1 hypothetical protein E2R51_16575 [Jeotgalibacillus sp. S-D1]